MKNFEEYEIQFAGLKDGQHEFQYQIDETFFALFDYEEFNSVEVRVNLSLEKKPNMLELTFEIDGKVGVVCDVSNVPYEQPIDSELNLKVKFGDEYNDEDDEYLILPHGAHNLQVQQYIYEVIILAVPYKKVHPKVEDGTMKSEILEKLKELSPGNNNKKEKQDPRWDELKKLLN